MIFKNIFIGTFLNKMENPIHDIFFLILIFFSFYRKQTEEFRLFSQWKFDNISKCLQIGYIFKKMVFTGKVLFSLCIFLLKNLNKFC